MTASLGALAVVATRVNDVSSVCFPASLASLYSQRKWIEWQRGVMIIPSSIAPTPLSSVICDY